MKIKLAQVNPLINAISALDGNFRAVKDGTSEKIVFDPYQLGSKFTWNKVKNLKLLRRKSEEIEEACADLWKTSGGEGKTKLEGPDAIAFNKAKKELLQTDEDMPLLMISEADLNIFDPEKNPSGNKIPATTIADLDVLLALPTSPSS
jgi:hypothetical protein